MRKKIILIFAFSLILGGIADAHMGTALTDDHTLNQINPMMGGYNMMNWGGGGSWLITFTWVVWTFVGVLLAIWLWQQITKK